MPRTLVALVTLLAHMDVAHSGSPPRSEGTAPSALFTASHPDNRILNARIPSDSARAPKAAFACCKVCSVGESCGNTCMARDETCNIGQGCACDG
jgi:hypothetical protein